MSYRICTIVNAAIIMKTILYLYLLEVLVPCCLLGKWSCTQSLRSGYRSRLKGSLVMQGQRALFYRVATLKRYESVTRENVCDAQHVISVTPRGLVPLHVHGRIREWRDVDY